MGGGGKGGSTTVQKMEIPPEVLARYNAVNARAETVAQTPYQAYSNNANAFVAPLTATQQAGIQNTNIMAGAAQPYYQAGAALTGFGAQTANPEALNVGQYYNPFTQAVAAPTLAALQQQQGVERSSLMNPQTARSFGGDRSGIVAANLARQQDLATAQAMAPIYQNAFTQALGAAQQQQGVGLAAQQANLNRLLQAGGQLGQLGTGAQQAGLAGAQAQLGAGQTEQQTQQAGLQALYNQFQQQQAYPFQIAQFLSNIATGTGALSGNQTTSTTTGGGGFFSDERLKENIQKVGETNDGQNIYRYNYKGDPRTQIGLLAQEVVQDHPEAVGKRDGYLTVDYRDATNDAVRDHKADGGSETGTSAYDISAPSAMLSGSQVGLGALQLPAMVGAAGLPIQAGAINPAAAGLMAPKATGYSQGSKEGAEAELKSLMGADMSKSQSGSDYFNWKKGQLQDFLANYDQNASSQGGLVSGPGAFSRGGYADAGYVNPALAYYGPQGAKAGLGGGGPYGAQLTPAQIAAMKAPEIMKPQQQKSGLAQAAETGAALTKTGEGLSGAGKWLFGSKNETTGANERGALEKAQDYLRSIGNESQNMNPPGRAHGGLIVREHHNTRGYVNTAGSPYGNPDDENNTLGATLTQKLEQHQMMQPGKMGQPTQGPSGAQQLGQAAGLANAGTKAYDWAAKKLAGDAAGTASTAAGTAGSTVTPIASSTGYVLPAAGEAAAAAAPAAEAAAGLGAGAAGAAEGAGLMGSLAAGAGAVGEGIMSVLPFLAFLSDKRAKTDIEHVGKLNDGQPVYRFRYKGDDKTRMGLMAQDVEQDHPEAVKGLGGVKMVDYKRATNDAVRQHHADGERVVETDESGAPVKQESPSFPSFLSSVGDAASSVAGGLGRAASGLTDTLKSKDETFWVPALAGLGSMLASRNPTLLGAVGEGLVGGTGSYATMQKQTADQLAKRLELSKGRFKGPTLIGDKDMYHDTIVGDYVTEEEMARRQGQFIGAGTPGAPTAAKAEPAAKTATSTTAATPPKVDAGVIDAAKKVITEAAPKIEPRPAETVTPPVVAAKPEEPVAKPEEPTAKPTEVDANRIPTKPELIAAARQNPALFAHLPEDRRPLALEAEAARLENEAKTYLQQSQEEARRSALTKGAEERTRLEASSKKFADLAKDRRAEATQKRTEANQLFEGAIELQLEEARQRTAAGVKREFEPEVAPGGEKVLLPPGAKMPAAVAPKPTPEQEAAPKTAEVDPKSGQLVLARPVAPAGGGLIQPSNLPPGTKVSEISATAKNQNELDQKFLNDFAEKTPSVQQARQRYMGLVNAFKLFESGSAESTLAGWAAVAQSFGYPDIAQKIASGDPAGVQWTQKIGPNLVLETLKAATPRFAQSEFMTLQEKGTPEPNKLPQANFQMVKEGLATLNRTEAFMQAWQRASQEEGWRSPSAYYIAWSKSNPIEKFEKAAKRQMGNFAGMSLPKAEEWTPGAVYVVPKNLVGDQKNFFTQRGLKAGDAFQYGGADAAPELVIRPIPKQQLYSMPAMGQ